MIEISNAESNHEKELEERLRSAIREEFQKKKMLNRKIAGLILSGIGAILYLIGGFICLGLPYYFGSLITPYLIMGVIGIIGTVIGLKKIKLGGAIVLIAIPLAFIVAYISTLLVPYFFGLGGTVFYFFLPYYPIPFFPSVALVIIGGILCVLSTDEEVSEQEQLIKNN